MPVRKYFLSLQSISKKIDQVLLAFFSTLIQLFKALFPLFIISGTVSYAAPPSIVIHWSTATESNSPDILKDRYGNPLDAGESGNGNGHAAVLGYFSKAKSDSLDNHFSGNWIPLTEGTTVGDSSSGYGYPDGMFTFTTSFTRSSDIVEVYPYQKGAYNVSIPFVITSTKPKQGTPICIRFYDDFSTGPEARFNTVTGPDWKWPRFSGGIPQNLYLKISSGTQPVGSSWKYGSHFEDPDHNFTTSLELQTFITTNIEGQGSVNDLENSYGYGALVAIVATPAEHMEFVEWVGDGVSGPNQQQTTILMTEDRNITARFQKRSYYVSLGHEGKGSVSITQENDSSTVDSGYFLYDTNLTITANSALGYQFAGWNGYGPENNLPTTTFSVSQNHAINAIFEPKSYAIDINQSSGGTASIVEDSIYLFDSNYTLHAIPNQGYSFSHWTSPTDSLDLLDSHQNSLTSFKVQGTAAYKANFELKTYQLQVITGSGGLNSSPNTAMHSALSLVPIETTPRAGYEFIEWLDPQGILINPLLPKTNADMTKTEGNSTITATFRKKTYNITLFEEEGGNTVISPANGPWEHNGVYEISANPQDGYSFSHWSGDANSTSSLQFGVNEKNNKVGVVSPISLTASFSKNEYTIETLATAGGEVMGGDTYSFEDAPKLEAIAQKGWHFSHWSGPIDLLLVPSSSSSLVNLTSAPLATSFTAHFARDIYNLAVSTDGNGTVNGKNSLTLNPDSGTEITLSALPTDGWRFDRWSGYGLSNPYENPLTFTPESEGSLTATFVKNHYEVKVSSSQGGVVAGGGIHEYGALINLDAIPSPGFQFKNWEGDTLVLLANSSKTSLYVLDRNISLEAKFSPIPLTVMTTVIGSGTATGAGTYDTGSLASLTATPIQSTDPNGLAYQLEKWNWTTASGEVKSSSDNPLVLFMDSNFSVEATFSSVQPDLVTLDLISSPANAGTLFDDPEEWNNANNFIQRNLTASPSPSFSFLGWTNTQNIEFSPSWMNQSVTISPLSNSSIYANFAPITHKVDVSYDSSMGLVEGIGGSFETRKNQVIRADPHLNYEFVSWELNKSLEYNISRRESSIGPSTQIFVDEREKPALTLLRGFSYTFNYNFADDEFIYFSTTPNNSPGIDEIPEITRTGNSVTLPISSSTPSLFYYHGSKDIYSGNVIRVVSKSDSEILPYPDKQSITPYLEFDLSLYASFQGKQIPVSIRSEGGGSIEGSDISNSLPFGTAINLIASPDEHFEFVRWEGLAQADNSINPEINLVVTEDINIKAIFKEKLYKLTMVTSPTSGGTAFTESNTYSFYHGSVVPILVVPKLGSKFEKWSDNVESPSNKETSITILGDTTVIAEFAKTQIVITKKLKAIDSLGNPINQDAGSINGGSSFALGANPTFKANPNNGFAFVHWENENGDILSTSQTAKIQITGFSELIAVFQQLTHSIEVTANPPGKGMIEWMGLGSGENIASTIPHGEVLTFRSTPNDGYMFEKWTSSSGDLFQSDDSTLVFSATQSMILNVRFTPINPVELTISQFPSDSGWTYGQGVFANGPTHAIFAKANPGFLFDYWEGEGIDNPSVANTKINLNKNKVIVAHFKTDPNYDPSKPNVINNSGLFKLRVSPSDIFHGSVSGSGVFGTGWANITANPSFGYEFTSWDGNSIEDKNAPKTFIFLTQDENITANFSKVYNLNIVSNDNTMGYVEGNGTFATGMNAISAIAKEGYTFTHWDGSKNILDQSEPYTFVDLQKDENVTAHFAKLHTISVVSSNINHGTTSGSGQYTTGNRYITASPNSGFKFTGWTGAMVDNNLSLSTSLILQKDEFITANFAKLFSLSLTTSNENHGSVLGGGIFTTGLKSISAEAYPGYTFSHWESSVVADKYSASTTIQLDKDISITAHFLKIHLLSLESSNPSFGSVSGSGTFTTSSVDITATPNPGYAFIGWEGEKIDNKFSPSTAIFLEKDAIIIANFAPSYSLSVNTSNILHGTVSGSGTFSEGSYDITANPKPGYTFQEWVGSSVENNYAAQTKVFLVKDEAVIAKFVKVYSLSLSPSNNLHGSVSGGGTFTASTKTITATPKPGYSFVRWEGGVVADEFASSTSISLNKDEYLTAIFEKTHAALSQDAQELGGGWWDNVWFGTYWNISTDWLYHEKFAWIHITENEDQSLWIWIDKLNGWYWTQKGSYPYLFSQKEGTWIWVDLEKSNALELLFFKFELDFKNGRWVVH